MLPPGITKATGLAVALERHGVGFADVLVFGDMPNDLPMIARRRRRPAAARSPWPTRTPTCRRGRRRLTSGHDADGVARYLEAVPGMSDWRPRLIASDMDGTLLRCDDTVSDATVAELERWRDDGVPVVLATGRPPRWMHGIRDVLGYGTAVCCNGAVLLDLEPFEVARRGAAAPRRSCRRSPRELRRRQPGTWFAVEYGLEFRHEPIYKPRWDVDAPGRGVATLEEMVAAPVAKLLARHEDLPREEFVDARRRRRAATARPSPTPRPTRSPRSPPRASPRRPGWRRSPPQHGVGPEDVVVFGDMPNDIAAFEWVRDGGGRAVAMARRAPRPAGRGHRRHRHQRRRRRRGLPGVVPR